MRNKKLQLHVTEEELALVKEAAKKADMSVSDYARKRLLTALLDTRNLGDAGRLAELLRERDGQTGDALSALEKFQRLFVQTMELNLAGKLTVARFRGLVERRSA